MHKADDVIDIIIQDDLVAPKRVQRTFYIKYAGLSTVEKDSRFFFTQSDDPEDISFLVTRRRPFERFCARSLKDLASAAVTLSFKRIPSNLPRVLADALHNQEFMISRLICRVDYEWLKAVFPNLRAVKICTDFKNYANWPCTTPEARHKTLLTDIHRGDVLILCTHCRLMYDNATKLLDCKGMGASCFGCHQHHLRDARVEQFKIERRCLIAADPPWAPQPLYDQLWPPRQILRGPRAGEIE